ncbi:MAG: DNA repair exonuclease [Deltaproteobacteria bacterium]|nr:DNA repair exonuclease [Deltaproteobacteria bacterium]
MTNFRFLHSADNHLDSPLRNLERYDGAPSDKIRNASREAFEKLIDLAIADEVSFLLISGDLYDRDVKDHKTGLFIAHQMSRLNQQGIGVYIIRGNHDAENQIAKRLSLPDNVHQFGHKKPETHFIPELKTAIHGQSFAERQVKANLAKDYPKGKKDYFNIGMLHSSLSGYAPHEPYAPCSLSDLMEKNYDYWALGHVHGFEIVSQKPWVVFPGIPQGRFIKETGTKGCVMVEVQDNKAVSVRHYPLDVLRWFLIEADITGAETAREAVEKIYLMVQDKLNENPTLPLALRIIITGSCEAHREFQTDGDLWSANLKSEINDLSSSRVWVEKIRFLTRLPLNIEERKKAPDILGSFLRSLDLMEQSDDSLETLLSEFSDLNKKLPRELVEEGNLLTQNRDDVVELLVEVRNFLTAKLIIHQN